MQEFDRETMGAQAPRQYEIAVESMDEVLRLFGVFDENLSIIQQETGANIKTDGGSISITGEAEAAALAHEVVDRLLTILRRGENIDRSRIRYAVDLAKEGNGELILELLDDVVAFTNKGRRIKCKTLGQKNTSPPSNGIRWYSGWAPQAPARPIWRWPWRYWPLRIKRWTRSS